MPTALRRGLLMGVALLVAWRTLRALRIAVTTLVRNQPHRIGNWFRSPATTVEKAYRNGFIYEIERQRAEEEGWRVAFEDGTKPGRIEVVYERVEPPFGADPAQPA